MEQIVAYENINHLEGIQALGNAIALSGMFGCDKPEQGIIIALQCMAENKPPLEMAKHYHIIKGRLTKRADSMLADFRKAGGKFIFEDLKNPTVQKARVEFEGYEGLQVEYSIDDAKQANVYSLKDSKGNPTMWAKYPANMLRARLVSETLRAIAPEIVVGVYTPEEIAQFDEPASASKPAPKSDTANPHAKPEPKKAEVVETEIINETTLEKLEMLIEENRAEEIINDYFVNKGMLEGKETWRKLTKAHDSMLNDFDVLLAAARKVEA